MSDRKPALTPEEWARLRYADDNVARQSQGFGLVYGRERIQRPVAFAALALYGRPEGFSQKDVDALRSAVWYDPTTGWLSEKLESLAARIAALLPPEAP